MYKAFHLPWILVGDGQLLKLMKVIENLKNIIDILAWKGLLQPQMKKRHK